MNKLAVALAADSASTSFHGGVAKIFNTADKLFHLDGQRPVGVMINDNADLMGIPWETLIKLFRRECRPCDYLEEYATLFIDFLKRQISDEIVTQYFQSQAVDLFTIQLPSLIRQQARADILSTPEQDLENTIVAAHTGLTNRINHPNLPLNTFETLLSTHKEWLDDLVDEHYPNVSEASRKKLIELVCLARCKHPMLGPSSGVVFAGFGEAEIFPSVCAYKINSIVLPGQILLSREDNGCDAISIDNNASILPFAQGQMVQTFIRGVDPRMRETVIDTFKVLTEQVAVDALRDLGNVPEDRAREMVKQQPILEQIAKEFDARLLEFSREHHIYPIVRAVSILPKDELAIMAETLVALTSFRRRMSGDLETVGGAVDVAVISKGDGFVWIKRKHYFDASLNPRYIQRLQNPC